MKRLNKFLAEAGIASRRKADSLIEEGRVAVDGRVVYSLGQLIDETKAAVTVNGKPVQLKDGFVYLLLNKPKGYVTTARDDLGRKTVFDLIETNVRLFPVGRLDKKTTGALLLTNDGELAYRLTHPKYNVKKTYHVWLDKAINAEHVAKLQQGILLEDGPTRPCEVTVVDEESRKIKMTLQEGRNREIRRMLAALDFDIKKLKRTHFAGLSLRGLAPGKWRFLTKKEITRLRKLALSEERLKN